MNVVELHPEDLIDKLGQGLLSDLERARLDAHVATCAACRFELHVRADFAEDGAQAYPAPVFIDPAPAEPVMLRENASRSPTRRRRPMLLLALAAALIGSVSLAALGSSVFFPTTTPGSPRRAQQVPSASTVGTATAARRAVAPVPAETATPLALNELPPTSSASAVPRRVVEAAVKQAPSAPALFRAANQARRSNKNARAVALYRALQAEYPSSAEARLSFATLASLQLDRGDTRSALDGFDEYLSRSSSSPADGADGSSGVRGGAPLVEEALVGRALALQKLDDRAAETAAWRDILRKFPKSVHARLARARLSALGDQ